ETSSFLPGEGRHPGANVPPCGQDSLLISNTARSGLFRPRRGRKLDGRFHKFRRSVRPRGDWVVLGSQGFTLVCGPSAFQADRPAPPKGLPEPSLGETPGLRAVDASQPMGGLIEAQA